jgi:hypothetical protein
METFSLVEEVLFTYEVSYFFDVNLDPFLGKLVPRLGKKVQTSLLLLPSQIVTLFQVINKGCKGMVGYELAGLTIKTNYVFHFFI